MAAVICPIHKVALVVVFDHIGGQVRYQCLSCQPPAPPPSFNTLYGDPKR